MRFYYLKIKREDWREDWNEVTKVIPICNNCDLSVSIKYDYQYYIGFFIDLSYYIII